MTIEFTVLQKMKGTLNAYVVWFFNLYSYSSYITMCKYVRNVPFPAYTW